MSQPPYDFFPGAPQPAVPAGPVAPPAGRRPGSATVLAGVLVAEAALAAAPAFLLLFVRDVLHSLLDQVAAGLSGAKAAGGFPGAPSPDTGRITLWGLFFLVVTVAVVQVGLLVWALAHLGSWSSVATVALMLAVTSGSLLALPDVRRWCLTGD